MFIFFDGNILLLQKVKSKVQWSVLTKNNLFQVAIKARKALARANVLVSLFWATVEIWWHNMGDSVEEDPLLMYI